MVTYMGSLAQAASLVLVGLLWGCTNPLLRSGSLGVNSDATSTTTTNDDASTRPTTAQFLVGLRKLSNVKVWLPYLLNQLGSVVFYVCLSQSDLSLTVPVCNSLALLFSIGTSLYLGESLDAPVRVVMGSVLIMAGTMVCLQASLHESSAVKE